MSGSHYLMLSIPAFVSLFSFKNRVITVKAKKLLKQLSDNVFHMAQIKGGVRRMQKELNAVVKLLVIPNLTWGQWASRAALSCQEDISCVWVKLAMLATVAQIWPGRVARRHHY